MSLLHPTPGTVIDRICILLLKIAAYQKAQRSTTLLEREKAELELHIKKFSPKNTVDNIVIALQVLNCKLWGLEDKVRSVGSDSLIAAIAKDIAMVNDERAILVRKLDLAYGCAEPTEEKVYE
jgi:hypothetical protein